MWARQRAGACWSLTSEWPSQQGPGVPAQLLLAPASCRYQMWSVTDYVKEKTKPFSSVDPADWLTDIPLWPDSNLNLTFLM